jgi:hypothetical protein
MFRSISIKPYSLFFGFVLPYIICYNLNSSLKLLPIGKGWAFTTKTFCNHKCDSRLVVQSTSRLIQATSCGAIQMQKLLSTMIFHLCISLPLLNCINFKSTEHPPRNPTLTVWFRFETSSVLYSWLPQPSAS